VHHGDHNPPWWTWSVQDHRGPCSDIFLMPLTRAKALILWYTLFVDPVPGPITFTSEVHGAWLKAVDYIADAGNLKASVETIKILSGQRYTGMMTPP